MGLWSPKYADVAKLADALDLGSSAARRMGSSPFIRTNWGIAPNILFPTKGAARTPAPVYGVLAQLW